MVGSAEGEKEEPLAVLLLPGRLEDIALEAHARDLLSIPRVIALEPPRVRLPRFLRGAGSPRQADRLRFPGRVRLLVLYHPAQYPLARALIARYDGLELWYIPPGREDLEAAGDRGLLEFDELARERASQVLAVTETGGVDEAALRERLRELGVISPYAFIPRIPPRRHRRSGAFRPDRRFGA
jgi:hypothetical protein